MCFTNDDYDWVARVVEPDDVTHHGPSIRCHDCYRPIIDGEVYRRTLWQEHEDGEGPCKYCDDYPCDMDEACEDSPSGKHVESPGETDLTRQCLKCLAVREAIIAVELAEGCKRHEAEPLIGELREALHSDVFRDDSRYTLAVICSSPGLGHHIDTMIEPWRWDRHHDDGFKGWDWRDLEPVAEIGGEG